MGLMHNFIYFFFGVSSASVVLILILPVWVGFDVTRNYSEIIRNLLLGIGPLFTGLVGFKVFWDYAEKQADKIRGQRWLEELRNRYPSSKIGENFRLIWSDKRVGQIWLHDL